MQPELALQVPGHQPVDGGDVPRPGMPSSVGEPLDTESVSSRQPAMHLAYYDRPPWAISCGTLGFSGVGTSTRTAPGFGTVYANSRMEDRGAGAEGSPVVSSSIRGGPFPLRVFRSAVERNPPSLGAYLVPLGYRG